MSQLIQSGGVQTVTQLNQIVYLDFDGEYTSYNGEILNVDGVVVEDSKLSGERIAEIVAALNEKYIFAGVKFVTQRPIDGEYSTVYVGKTDDFDQYGNFAGLAETVDKGNANKSDKAFVMLDSTASNAQIVDTISHETEHLLGTLDHGGTGLDAYATYTHHSNFNYIYVDSGDSTTGFGYLYTGMGYTLPSPDPLIVVGNGGIAKNIGLETVSSSIYKAVYSMHVSSGGTAINCTLRGGYLHIENGATVSSLKLSMPTNNYPSDQGYNIGYDVDYYGEINLIKNIHLGEVRLQSGAYLIVNDTCSVNSVVANRYTSLSILSGGEVDNLYLRGPFVSIHVASGGLLTRTFIDSGSIGISPGGVANSTTVNSRGSMCISSGGVANNTTVNSGGKMYIVSGGTAKNIEAKVGARLGITVASNTYIQGIYDGSAFEMKNAQISGFTVNSGGSMYISSGGVANSTTVNVLGYMDIYSGGVANSTTISGGYMDIYSGGVANSTTVNSRGSMDIYSGGVANSTTVNSRGAMYISSGVANSTTVNSGGSMDIYSGGDANSSTVNSDGNMRIFSGGVANSTTVNSGGHMGIYSGGTANSTTVNSGGYMGIASGGVANSITVNSGGSMDIASGGVANSTTVNSDGNMRIFSGGVANSTTVNSGGYMGIASGGTAKMIKENGGYVNVADGANVTFASNTISGVNLSYNSMSLHSNTVANSTTVNSYGDMTIFSGGVANSTTVISNGSVYIHSGGTANSTTVNSWGSIFISSGGTANSTTINRWGSMSISSGGIANSTTVNSYGDMSIFSGGVANSTTVNSWGSISISSGGTANSTTVKSRGDMYIFSGGVANSTTVNSSGTLNVYDGAKVTGVTFKNGGIMNYYGGTAYNVDLLYGGVMNIQSGAVRKGQIADKGQMFVSNGGTASGAIIKNGGIQHVLSGGSADDTQIWLNGVVHVSSGAVVTDMLTKHGAKVHVFGGTISNTTMERGITSVYQGGTAVETEVGYGAYLMLGFTNSGCSGVASSYDTTVLSGGGLTVMSGAVAEDNVIYGTLNCNNGGILLGETTIHSRANLAGNAVVTDETSITFDVSGREVSAMQESYYEAMLNSYYVAREADMTISVAADQASGSYILANWALEAKKGTFTLEVDGTEVGTFSTTKSLTYDGKTYSLYCFDDSTNSKALTLKVCDATSTDAWTDLGFGDFDGNGIEELLVSDGTNLYAASEDLWLGNLSGTEEIAGIADYNNDGTDDLLIHNTATDQMTAWLIKDGTTYSTLAIA